MPYLSSVERLAKEEGRQEGVREGLLEAIEYCLQLRFGQAGLELLAKIRALENNAQLHNMTKTLMTADSLDALRDLLS